MDVLSTVQTRSVCADDTVPRPTDLPTYFSRRRTTYTPPALQAGLSFARKHILHSMSGDEVQYLRELLSVMPRASVANRTLRTFAEIEAVYKGLSMEDTRRMGLKDELDTLRGQMEAEKALAQSLANDLEEELSNNAILDGALKGLRAALEIALLPEGAAMALGGVETVVSRFLMKKAGQLKLAEEEAEARIQEIGEEMKLKGEELRREAWDPRELEKATADYEELHKLSIEP